MVLAGSRFEVPRRGYTTATFSVHWWQMSRLHLFIDGTWLFNQCAPDGCLANATDSPTFRFPLDFDRLTSGLIAHAKSHGATCSEPGDRYLVTSIFTLPDDFDDWSRRYDGILPAQIEKTKRAVHSRDVFAQGAIDAGFKPEGVLRPKIREHIIRKLARREYQEKQVDTTVVALLVRSAFEHPDDIHVVITGDSDMLPAIRVAYPGYTENVLVATTHPDELKRSHQQTSYDLLDFNFKLPPYFLQDHAHGIIAGPHAHKCGECGKVFTTNGALPKMSRPYCRTHRTR